MAYQALYRRYRPRKFGDVIGQEHITTTLQNQVRSGRIAHAYLFCGSRGTGKTSTAKIFARAINCLSPIGAEPCDSCENCLGNGSEGLDIIEIDAASNNGVDEIRDLREKVRFAPLSGKYKIYIIDEVHMLSAGAFNALLKTLEEPPSHAVFILATTEPQKLPATILSRCQRYEFHRVSVGDIVRRLKAVLQDAGASIEEAGLHAIARAAEGGMRDALSLADQCIAFCGNEVSTQSVLHVLGSMDQEFMFEITDALIGSDERRALIALDSVFDRGRDLSVFCRDLLGHFRSLMLIAACVDARDLLDCADETYRQLQGQAKNCPLERILRAIALLSQADSDMKYLSYPRVVFEAALLRICRPQDEQSIESLLDRVAVLEERMCSGVAFAPSPQPAAQQPPEPQIAAAESSRAEAPLPPTTAQAVRIAAQPQPKGSRAQELFDALLPHLPPQTQALAKSATPWEPQMADESTLLVILPPAFRVVADALNAKAPQFAQCLEQQYPGLQVRFAATHAANVPKRTPEDEIAKVKRVFGDNVAVEIIRE